ncbi:hypothetical protein KBC70_02125 [Candidatus Woesebacteria bacterium]|jgi:hypothetical protein|nr:hypothetical protein [Candidatus Woesebacteria bacterium]
MHYLGYLLQAEITPKLTCKNFPPACFSNFADVGTIALPLMYGIALILVLVHGIRGAFKYINSAGDAKAVEEGKNTITYSVIGIILIFLSYFLTRLVASFFNIEFLL